MERSWKSFGPRWQQVLFKYGSSYVRVHHCRLALEHSHDKTDNKVSATLTPNDSIQEQPKERVSRYFDEDSDEELDSQEEQNNNGEMNMLSNSMKRLSMSQPLESSSTITKKKDIQLKRNMKVQFISKNTNPWNTATLLSQSGKSTGKYSKAWNSQLPEGSVKSIHFQRGVTMLEEIPDPIALERYG